MLENYFIYFILSLFIGEVLKSIGIEQVKVMVLNRHMELLSLTWIDLNPSMDK